MKKYIVAFFTFLGYVAFISLLGAGIVVYIGYRKSQAAEAAVMSSPDGQVVHMHPKKQTDTATTLPETLPHFQPISRKPVSAAAKPKSVRPKPDKKATKPAKSVSVAPAQYTTVAAAPAATTRKPTATAKKPAAIRHVKIPAKHSPTAAKASMANLGLPAESIRAYRVTDNGASPRTGRGIINVAETTELERQVMKRAEEMRQLKAAVAKIRDPYGVSGIEYRR